MKQCENETSPAFEESERRGNETERKLNTQQKKEPLVSGLEMRAS